MAKNSSGRGIKGVLFIMGMVASLEHYAIILSQTFVLKTGRYFHMRNMTKKRRRASGFSLMELLIVIMIMGVLMGIAIVNLQGTPNEARIAAAGQEIRTMGTALDMYSMHNASYPTTEEGLKALVEKSASAKRFQKGGYLRGKSVPKDPWDNPYVYNVPGRSGEFEVYSLGPDGRESDDDIGSWMLE